MKEVTACLQYNPVLPTLQTSGLLSRPGAWTRQALQHLPLSIARLPGAFLFHHRCSSLGSLSSARPTRCSILTVQGSVKILVQAQASDTEEDQQYSCMRQQESTTEQQQSQQCLSIQLEDGEKRKEDESRGVRSVRTHRGDTLTHSVAVIAAGTSS